MLCRIKLFSNVHRTEIVLVMGREWEWVPQSWTGNSKTSLAISCCPGALLQGRPARQNGGDHDWLIQTPVSTVQWDTSVPPEARHCNVTDGYSGFLTYQTSVLSLTESWQCYRSRYVNILCEMLISWGNVWLTDRRSLIKRLIGSDLGWGHKLWPEVDISSIWHSPMFYCCTALLVHTISYFIWCFI